MFTTDALIGTLRLEPAGPDRYRGTTFDPGHGVVLGGQLLAQSVIAALDGQEAKRVKTLHTMFARAGRPDAPVELTVDCVHQGRTFAGATVTLAQGERLCARSQVLLSADEPDFIRHSDPAPDLSPPDLDASSPIGGEGGWHVVVDGDVDLDDPDAVGPPELDVWTRFDGVPEDPAVGQALLAFVTDNFLIGTAMRPHAGVGQSQAHVTVSTGVVSHTITFHEPVSVADWLLLRHRSPYAGHGRSYGTANVFRRDGTLVASFVQDAMIRPLERRRDGAML